jgi:purine-binding chemotaxis protein CheW
VNASSGRALLVQAGGLSCALPLACVVETMRAQPLSPVRSAPDYVRGMSVIRGQCVPIVDVALLLGRRARRPEFRLVVVRGKAGPVGLSVDHVLGVRALSGEQGAAPAGLLQSLLEQHVISLRALDSELLVVLSSAALVTDADLRDFLAEGP